MGNTFLPTAQDPGVSSRDVAPLLGTPRRKPALPLGSVSDLGTHQ
jgi:hypothetical protein